MELITSDLLNSAISKLRPFEKKQIFTGLEWLSNNGLLKNLVMIGGCAIATYCPGRELTPDFDLVASDFDLARIIVQLENDDLEYKPLMTNSLIGYQIPIYNVDVIKPGDGNDLINYAFKYCHSVELNSIKVKVIIPELLLIIKLLLGREKDLNDAFRLVESKAVDNDKYNQLLDLLFNDSLNSDYELLKSYSLLLN